MKKKSAESVSQIAIEDRRLPNKSLKKYFTNKLLLSSAIYHKSPRDARAFVVPGAGLEPALPEETGF